MGLTGVITWAQLRLKPIVSRMVDYQGIQFHGIDEFLELTEQSQHIEYTVSWVDVTSTGKNFCRGIFMQGDHSQVPGAAEAVSSEPKLTFPMELPGWALNGTTVGLFNTLFFNKQMKKPRHCAAGLRAVLLSARRRAEVEQDVRQARAAAVPVRHPVGERARRHGRDPAGGREDRPGELPRCAEGVRRCAFAGHDELSQAGHHAGAGFSHQAGEELRVCSIGWPR